MAIARAVAFTLRVPFPTGLTITTTVSKDDGAFAAATNSCTEIGSTGAYSLTLTAAEMTADKVDVLLVPNTGTALLATIVTDPILHDFDPASDTVARVTLVDTCTTNTDMRGTDGANTIEPDNANIAAAAASAATAASNAADAKSSADLANRVAPDNAGIASAQAAAEAAQAAAEAAQAATVTLATEANATTNKNAIIAAMPTGLPPADGVTITQATLGTDGLALGRVMPYGHVVVYRDNVAEYEFNADADGDYSYKLPDGSIWTLVARASGYQTTTAEVSTVSA